MKNFTVVFIALIFLLVILGFWSGYSAEKAKTPIVNYDFESGGSEDWILQYGAEITTEKGFVLSGKASVCALK